MVWERGQEARKAGSGAAPAWHAGVVPRDGGRHEHSLVFAVGSSVKCAPKELVQEMLRAAYDASYGALLDLVDSDKWIILKNF